MNITLAKGRQEICLNLPDEKLLGVITGKAVPALSQDQLRHIICEGIKVHTPKNITRKKIVVIIPDHTRLWARGDLCVPWIVQTLMDLGCPAENMKIIIALGTHDDMPPSLFPRLAGAWCSRNIEILNSANRNQARLQEIGITPFNTRVFLTAEAVAADHVIVFGGILHHMLAGFGGGRKYILPGIAGYDTIQQNHSLAMDETGAPHPWVRQAELEKNPVNQDMEAALDLFLQDKTCTYAAVAANGMGRIFYARVGPLKETFHHGCQALNRACCVSLPRKGDFVLVSAGGIEIDTQLYQAMKALVNAVNLAKKGASVLFVAGCSDGVGNETFARAMKTFKDAPEQLGKKLAGTFDMPAYVALRLMTILRQYRVTLVSDLSCSLTRELGFYHVTDGAGDLAGYIQTLGGKGYVIPFGENILPLTEQATTVST
jgi:nickel-dependent lactate racemase